VNANGTLTITQTDPVTLDVVQALLPMSALSGFAGSLQCSSPLALLSSSLTLASAVGPGGLSVATTNALVGCKVVSLSSSPQGMSGSYDLPPAVVTALATEASSNSSRRLLSNTPLAAVQGAYSRWKQRFGGGSGLSIRVSHDHRLLATSSDGASALSIFQPVVCIRVGDSVAFDLGVNKSSYPVYDKDSLLNTNPSFDYGEFRRLAELARSSSNVTVFGFTFNEKGVYVFYSNGVPTVLTVITVRQSGESCPTDGSISPMTATTLVQLGVKRDSKIVVAPSWPVIIAILVGLALAAIAALGTVYWLQHSDWDTRSRQSVPGYKQAARAVALADWRSLGTTLSSSKVLDTDGDKPKIPVLFPSALKRLSYAEGVTATSVGPTAYDQDDLDARELLERLNAHRDDVKEGFDSSIAATEGLSKQVAEEFERLKHQLTDLNRTIDLNSNARVVQDRIKVVLFVPRCAVCGTVRLSGVRVCVCV
jgi:hypothetical protein